MNETDIFPFTDDVWTDKQAKELQKRAIQIIKPLIPPDAKDRVSRTVKQLNSIIRQHIRSETGLRLADENNTESVSIKIAEGFPLQVARLIDEHDDLIVWRLIMAQPKLGGIVDGLNALLDHWDEFERWRHLPEIAKGAGPTLERTRDIAFELQKLAAAKQIIDKVKQIAEDILGAYVYSNIGQHIEIYWMAIALFSGAFGVRIEDLTAVTLAHELAHAYTHIGKDIDGNKWKFEGFSASDCFVKEGLAQYYTAATAEKLRNRAPLAQEAFETLLYFQSEAYHAHEDWQRKLSKREREIVRFTMLRARTEGKVDHSNWLDMMQETKRGLKSI